MLRTSTRPILYDYFDQSADILLKEYERSKILGSGPLKGACRELVCEKFLRPIIPSRLTITTNGEIWDSNSNKSEEQDIIITRDDGALLGFQGINAHLVESVFAVIQVKSKLDPSNLKKALKSLKTVKALQPSFNSAIAIPPKSRHLFLERPLLFILAFDCSPIEKLLPIFMDPENRDIVDVTSVIGSYAFIKPSKLFSPDDKFTHLRGKAASLAFLYLLLITYARTYPFLAPNTANYFNPISNWSD